MLNTKKTICQSNHRGEILYSGFVTVVTNKTIVVFVPALDVEVDVQRDPDASVQNSSVGNIATVQIVLEDGDYAATAAMFVPQQDIRETFPSPMTTFFCLMTTRKQRNATGTTSLSQTVLTTWRLTESLILVLRNL